MAILLSKTTMKTLIVPCLLLMGLAEASTGEKPNIVLVMADDQGWGDMAYNGHPVLETPNFDRAAAAGLRFDRFYAAAPVCSPTRASVLTGRHPNRSGVLQWGYPIRPQETTLAETLKTAGYTTAHFGKWHLGSVRRDSPAHPGVNGFDHWLSAPNYFDNDPIFSLKGKAVQAKGESSRVIAEAALAWIRERVRERKPFLAVVWFGSPHGPHQAAEEYRKLYDDQPEKMQNFLGEISGMDHAFGKLRSSLRELGIRENTVLWYCSDNGALRDIGSSGGRRGHKGTLYEGGLLVPSILEWPARLPTPGVTNFRATTSDIYPTLMEIVGVHRQHQPPLDGISLLGLIDGRVGRRQKPMGFWDYPTDGIGTPSAQWMGELLKTQASGGDLPPHRSSQLAAQLPQPPYPKNRFPGHSAWIDGDWKLHRISDNEEPRWELYNLVQDPKEEYDRSSGENGRVREMRETLEAWLVSVVESLNGEDY